MKLKTQKLLLVLVGGVWLVSSCSNPLAQPNPSTPAITPTPTYEAPLPKPRFCTPVPDQDEQLAAWGREWPRPTWLPERLKLCEIDRRLDDLGERVVLSFEGEGRFYNSVSISITRYIPPKQRGETELELLRVNGIEIHKSFSYGHTILTWPLARFWIQLVYLGDALDEDEAIQIAKGVIPPP